ncbi:MAG: hypothetical protein PHX18_01355 [Candidatus Gastranaerophilales bacterium]|nr:hypothetical protein [Candidatus Gastranaerophilales bacterium]
MIGNVNNENLLNNQSLLQNQDVKETDVIKQKALKNAYNASSVNLMDESDISNEAITLYEKEQELNKYKNILNTVSEEEANEQVAQLMEQGVIEIDEENLASSMLQNADFRRELEI